MAETVRDLAPYIDYSRRTNTYIIQKDDITPYLTNYVKDVRDELLGEGYKPTLIDFGGHLYIAGSNMDVLYGSSFIKKNPSVPYNVNSYGTDHDARNNFFNTYGFYHEHFEDNTPIEAQTESLDFSPWNKFWEAVESNVIFVLKQYFRDYMDSFLSGRPLNKGYLLIGHTGISKSSIVYRVIQEMDEEDRSSNGYGYRVVELKAGFLDKSDLMGFAEDIELEDGSSAFTDSPNKLFLTCTTSFVKKVREWLENNADKETEENKQFFFKLRYYAKTPVLFLDEVNRSLVQIQRQIQEIVNSSKIGSYDLSIAPKIAAANFPIDIQLNDDQDPNELYTYLTDEGISAAFKGRFIPLLVSHKEKENKEATLEYLLQKYKDSPESIKALEWADKNDALYDPTVIDDFGKFPTFRGWDDACRYISWIEETGEEPIALIFNALLGKTIDPKDFISTRLDTSEIPQSYLPHCIKSGVPVFLVGMMGIAKTALVKKFTKGNNILDVSLAAEDKLTVLGNPHPADFIKTIMEEPIPYEDRPKDGSYNSLKDIESTTTEIFKDFEKEIKQDPTIPSRTTRFTPNANLKRLINNILLGVEKAKKNKEPLVIILDEFNNCHTIVQSAIFEIISNKRFKGIDLSDIKVSVVGTGNWQSKKEIQGDDATGVPQYGDVFGVSIDTAALHRGAFFFIDKIEPEFMDEWLLWAKEESPFSYKLFKDIYNKEPEKLLEALNTRPNLSPQEARSIINYAFTFREMDELGRLIKSRDFDVVTDKYTSENKDYILSVISSPLYIGTKILPNNKNEFLNATVQSVYGVKNKTITRQEYINKTIELLSDANTTSEDIDLIVSNLILNEQEILNSTAMFGPIKKQLPEQVWELIYPYIIGMMEARTKARVSVKSIDIDMFGNAKEMQSFIKLFVAQNKAGPELVDLFKQAMIEEIKNRDKKVNLSTIQKLMDTFNTSLTMGVALSPIDISNTLVAYPDKVNFDMAVQQTVELKDLVFGYASEEISNLLSTVIDFDVLDKSFDTITNFPEITVNDNDYQVYFYIGAVITDLKEGTHLPDFYSLRMYTGDTCHSIFLEPSLFKIGMNPIKEDDTPSVLDIDYKIKIGFIEFIILAGFCRNFVHPEETKDFLIPKEYLKKIFTKEVTIPKVNSVLLSGVAHTMHVHGGDIKDIPLSDNKQLDHLDKMQRVTKKPDDQHQLNLGLGSYYKSFFRISWKFIEKAFAN